MKSHYNGNVPPLKKNRPQNGTGGERALLAGIQLHGISDTLAIEYLDELELLAQTAGAQVVGRELVKLYRRNPATYIGTGKVAEFYEIARETGAELLIFDEDLSPAQARNLEQELGLRVIDRAGLILDIFARRARTRESKTQVELAQLKYILPRLTRAWTHLERQQGGIGLRGPGETQIETDRRLIRSRIRHLEEELHHIERTRQTQRSGRWDVFRFALAGYTNVGKSTLMNLLTKAGVYEEDLLFATLDSTTRLVKIAPQYRALLTDTVGFIRKLPPGLVASFRSTLAEIREADCIIHVADIASPSFREQMAEVETILMDMEVAETPQIIVFNKIDALEDDLPRRWAEREYPDAVFISARNGENILRLQDLMKTVMLTDSVELTLDIPVDDGVLIADIHRFGEILDESHFETFFRLHFRLPRHHATRLGLLHETPSRSPASPNS